MISLGTVIYLVARAVPRIEDDVPASTINGGLSKIDRWLNALRPERFDAILNVFLEKFLRKVRLILMRIDNTVNGYLSKIKKINGDAQKSGTGKPNLFSSDNSISGDSADNGQGLKE